MQETRDIAVSSLLLGFFWEKHFLTLSQSGFWVEGWVEDWVEESGGPATVRTETTHESKYLLKSTILLFREISTFLY